MNFWRIYVTDVNNSHEIPFLAVPISKEWWFSTASSMLAMANVPSFDSVFALFNTRPFRPSQSACKHSPLRCLTPSKSENLGVGKDCRQPVRQKRERVDRVASSSCFVLAFCKQASPDSIERVGDKPLPLSLWTRIKIGWELSTTRVAVEIWKDVLKKANKNDVLRMPPRRRVGVFRGWGGVNEI